MKGISYGIKKKSETFVLKISLFTIKKISFKINELKI
jgi:hypothetical protein